MEWKRATPARLTSAWILSRSSSHTKSPTNRMRIGFIGQILPHKGLDLLVDALAKMQNQDSFELLIYGSLSDPSEKNYFDSLDLRAIKNQKCLGIFDLSKMNQILQNIDLLVVPSRWPENCPLGAKIRLAHRHPAAHLGRARHPG